MKRSVRDGFTLVEAVAALFLGLLISVAALTMVSAVQRAQSRFQADAHRAASLRLAASRICRTLRQSGGPAFAPFESAGPESLTLLRDLDGDGLAESSGEVVSYRLDNGILRERGRPVAEGLETMAFTYRVAAGADGLPDHRDNDSDGLVDERGELQATTEPDEAQRWHVTLVELVLTGHGPLETAAERELRTAVALINNRR